MLPTLNCLRTIHHRSLRYTKNASFAQHVYLMPDTFQILATAAVLAIAGFIIGAVGFGFGLTTSPTLLLFLDPQTVVVVVNAVAIIAFALVLVETREHAKFREQTPLAIAGAIGTPIGVFALSQLDASILRIAIGILILALTGLVVFKSEWRVPYPQFTGPILGFVSAAMTTGLTIGGPILVLFFLGCGMQRQELRASMAYFFTIMYIAAAIGYATQGLFNTDRLILIAAAAPGVALAFWIATRLTGRMNETIFRRAVVTIITISSIVVVARELLSFLD